MNNNCSFVFILRLPHRYSRTQHPNPPTREQDLNAAYDLPGTNIHFRLKWVAPSKTRGKREN